MNTKMGLIVLLVAMAALLAVACGSSSTATPQGQPSPTEKPIKGNPPPVETLPTANPIPGDPPPEEPPPVSVLAPIEDASIMVPGVVSGNYVLNITSGLPNGCAEFNGYAIEQDGNEFTVVVNNLVPHPSLEMACTEIYGLHEGQVTIGSGLAAGETYRVSVNEDLIISFSALDAAGLDMVEKESPIEDVEVSGSDGSYNLTIVSRLPKGSSCSRFGGYKLNQRFLEYLEVSVTHREVSEDNVPCTRDLPAVVTVISLGADFVEGTTYTVVVNGQETMFPSVDLAPVVTEAPIEDVTLVTPESADGAYSLDITSGLPSGCAEFNEIQVEQDGNEFTLEVTNLMPNPMELVACTAIYGYHESKVTLGSGLTAGDAYTVTINGDLTILFTVPQETEFAWVEKESPVGRLEVSETGDGYLLSVVSSLPTGSSCSKFSGYQINRRFFDRVEINLTHIQIADENVACTADAPVVLTEIPLGDGFETGRTYTVSVNEEETSFTAR